MPWPPLESAQYGLGENPRRNLAALIDFVYRYGAMQRPVPPEELFIPASLAEASSP